MYRILALDLDGTLTNGKKEITPRTRKALEECAQRGVSIVLASGRPLIGMLPLGKLLELDRLGGYLMAYNGAQIYDCRQGKVVVSHTLPHSIVPTVCETARRFQTATVTYDEHGIVTDDADNFSVRQESYNNRIGIRQVDDLPSAISWDMPKLMISGEHENLLKVQQELTGHLRGIADVYFSEPIFLEVVPCGIDKATGLASLLERLNLTREELMSFGDAMNDLPMLRFAGMGVAMANSFPAVLESDAYDYVTASNEEDGVALALEKFILNA